MGRRSRNITLSGHALENIRERFAPADPVAWAIRQFGTGLYMGPTRDGREVYETHEARIVVAFEPRHIQVVTAMPADWPVDIIGLAYDYRGDLVPAAPAALRRLAARFRA